LRHKAGLRNLVRETKLSAHDFVLPLFVSERVTAQQPIDSMPGVFKFALAEVADESQRAYDLGLQAVLLFGIPKQKDEQATSAYAENGIAQQAVRAIKARCPELVVITDVCLCEYMSHGHRRHTPDGEHFQVLNDESVELLAKAAPHAAAARICGPAT
jgi:porphobilinogen synthase